jgi:hypothetical protein
MGFYVAAWRESTAAMTALDYIAALVDQKIRTQNDSIIVPEKWPNIGGVYAGGAGIARCQIDAPSLRSTFLPDIKPVDVSAEPTSNPPFAKMFDNPLMLKPSEELKATIIHANTEYDTVAVWLMDTIDDAPTGEIFTVRFTGATTLTANAWTLVPLTISQQLPVGNYAVVGMRADAAGGILARLVFSDDDSRPGVICFDAVSDLEPEIFRYGNLGKFGEFTNLTIPQAEFLSTSADTAEVIELDLIKL